MLHHYRWFYASLEIIQNISSLASRQSGLPVPPHLQDCRPVQWHSPLCPKARDGRQPALVALTVRYRMRLLLTRESSHAWCQRTRARRASCLPCHPGLVVQQVGATPLASSFSLSSYFCSLGQTRAKAARLPGWVEPEVSAWVDK